jgi:hypothetical protein
MITVETPLRMIETELALLQARSEGPDADFVEGAIVALLWLKDGTPPPHESL